MRSLAGGGKRGVSVSAALPGECCRGRVWNLFSGSHCRSDLSPQTCPPTSCCNCQQKLVGKKGEREPPAMRCPHRLLAWALWGGQAGSQQQGGSIYHLPAQETWQLQPEATGQGFFGFFSMLGTAAKGGGGGMIASQQLDVSRVGGLAWVYPAWGLPSHLPQFLAQVKARPSSSAEAAGCCCQVAGAGKGSPPPPPP